MFRVILLGFLVFTMSNVVMPTSTYAISLDDDEEDAEDVADLLDEAKKAGKSESFSKADALLKKAKMYGVATDDTQEASRYVAGKKQARDERLERERKERERLARLKREKEERARQSRLARQRQQAYSSNGFRGISKNDCHRISQYGPREVCLKGTGGNACHGLQNYALREVCLKGAGTNACHSFNDYGRREVCLKGIRSNACHAFENYNKRNSCQKFGGSTEFWLIFSSYGYYTW